MYFRKYCIMSVFAAVMLSVLFLFPIRLSAEETGIKKTEDYIYRYNAEYKGIEILLYRGTKLEIEIPETLDKYPVTVIGEEAFCGDSTQAEKNFGEDNNWINCRITKIVIPKTVAAVQKSAFRGCGVKEKIELPENLKVLSDSAFSGCHRLTEIILPKQIQELGDEVFSECNSLRQIDLPDSMTEIPDRFFKESGLFEITIPKNIVHIGDEAFLASSLEKIEFEEGSQLNTIGNRTFAFLKRLKEITFPDSLQEIGDLAFCTCKKLEKIEFGTKSKLKKIKKLAFCNSRIKKITLSKSVKEIGKEAFHGCRYLKKINLKGKPPVVGREAFADIHKKAVFKVQKKYKKAYKKVLDSKSGFQKPMRIA